MRNSSGKDNQELTLNVTLDRGQINKSIETDTGATLKIITTKDDLLQWIIERLAT